MNLLKRIRLKLDRMGILKMDDKKYCDLMYQVTFGKPVNWDDPRTFNEKVQWMKLYNQQPEYTEMVDKYEVKKYIAKKIGAEYVIPALGIHDTFDEINFDKLPDKFVMKCTHDSGTVIICKDKREFDVAKARRRINKALKHNFYVDFREWPYKNVKPRILVEDYVEDKNDGELRDYKFYCFDGTPHALLLATDRMSGNELCFDYFDMNFSHLQLVNHWHPNARSVPHKPKHFEKMKELAGKLSKGFPHVRVDFYEANGRIYVGELTLFDAGGLLVIHPDEWDREWGDLIKLPSRSVDAE